MAGPIAVLFDLDETLVHTGGAASATTIGVTSGHYHADELRAAQADHVLHSLTDPFPGL
jgi:phosphoglycolate phosphatase